MKWRKQQLVILILCVFFGFSCQRQDEKGLEESNSHVDIEAEISKVRTVLDSYSLAWQTKDMKLFSSIFANDGDLLIFDSSPVETYVGWEQWKGRIQSALEGINIDDVSFSETKIVVHSSGLAAWMSGKMSWGGVVQNQSIGREGVRVTMVFEKRAGNWISVHMHFSLSDEK